MPDIDYLDAPPFAVYVTAADSIGELNDARESGRLSQEAAWAVHVVDAAMKRSGSKSELDALREYFGEFDDDAGMSRANALRVRCGGELCCLPETDSPIAAQLLVLARDLFPLFLLQPAADGFYVDPYEPPAWDRARGLAPLDGPHPAATSFVRLLKDEPPHGMADIAEDRLLWSERIDVGRFRGGGHLGTNLRSLYCTLLNSAFRSVVGTGRLTPARLVARALVELDRLQRSLRGEPIEISVLHGLDGIYLVDDVVIEVPWGCVRRLRKEEARLADDHRRDLFERKPVPGVSAVLEARGTLWRSTDQKRPSWWEEPLPPTLNSVERLQLALLITSGGTGTVTPVWCISADAQHVAHPLGEREAYLHARTAMTVGRFEGDDKIRALGEWSRLIDSHHGTGLNVPARRLLRARLERARPDDALVDSMIALESLFAGATRGEITFRVSSAVAWLLAPDDARQRAELAREVRFLYGRRSAIVHGASRSKGAAGQTSPWEHRDQAVRLVVRCFEVLYRDRPDLIDENSRGEMLSLGQEPGV